MLGSHNDLNIFQGGSITGTCCCTEIILHDVRLPRCAMGFQILFVGDNATPHRTVAVSELLESGDMNPMDLLARST